MIDRFVASDMTSRRLLEKLRGGILFARSLCFGRFAGCALRTLNRHCAVSFVASVRKAGHADDEELREVLPLLSRAVWESPPREVSVKYSTPVLLATDGAFDELSCGVARAGVGGILIDRAAHTFCYFAGVLSDAAVHEVLLESRNPIAAVELAACCVLRFGIEHCRDVLSWVSLTMKRQR